MQLKYGLKSALRMPGGSVLTMLLFFLAAALLGSIFSVSAGVRRTLRQLDQSYVTLAVIEAKDPETADPELLSQLAASLTALPDPPGGILWQPETRGQAWLPQAQQILQAPLVSGYGVAIVSTREPGASSSRGTVPGVVRQVLFSRREVEGKTVELYHPALLPGREYLVYGRWYEGDLSAAASMELLRQPLELQDAAHWEDTPGAEEYANLARQLAVRARSAPVVSVSSVETALPFQQGLLKLTQGRLFTPQELAQGARVCLLPEKLASRLGCAVGDCIPMSIAAGDCCPALESYDPSRGFDLEDSYTVVGLLYGMEEWAGVIVIPPQPGLDLTRGFSSARLGAWLLENPKAEEYLIWAEANLPPTLKTTVYDQGYGETARPLKTLEQTTVVLLAVCLLAGGCFLCLSLWLYAQRQGKTCQLMHRLGVSGRGIWLYRWAGLLPSAVPGILAGVWLSGAVGSRLARLLARGLAIPAVDDRYSDAGLSFTKRVPVLVAAPGKELYLLLGLGLLAYACLGCVVPTARKTGKGTKHAVHTGRSWVRTQNLSGGAGKYALLCAQRGGFRTVVSLAAPFAAACLFCALSAASVHGQTQLRLLEQQTTIRGAFVSLDGASFQHLVLHYSDVAAVADLPQSLHLTVLQSGENLDYVGKLRDWTYPDGFAVPEVPHGKFRTGITAARLLRSGIHTVYTTSMEDVPDLQSQAGGAMRWMDGVDDSIMAGWRYAHWPLNVAIGTVSGSADWAEDVEANRQAVLSLTTPEELPEAMPCVVSAQFLTTHDLTLGEDFVLCGYSDGVLNLYRFQAVGCYQSDLPRQTVYLPCSVPASVGAGAEQERLDWVDRNWRDGHSQSYGRRILDRQTVEGAVFRFRCSDLTAVRDALEALGMTEVREYGRVRKPFLLEDQSFLTTRESIRQRIWQMDHTFPIITVLAMLLGLGLSGLQTQLRSRELWLMLCMGTGRGRTFFSIFLEQAVLCPAGAVLGACLLWNPDQAQAVGLAQTAVFVLVWLAGTAGTCLRLMIRPKKRTKEEE